MIGSSKDLAVGEKVIVDGVEQTVTAVDPAAAEPVKERKLSPEDQEALKKLLSNGNEEELVELEDVVFHADDSYTVTRKDGSKITVKPRTGQTVEEHTNGTKITMNPDGNTVVLGPDKKKNIQLNEHLVYCRALWQETHTEPPPIFVTEDDRVVWVTRRTRKMQEAQNRRAFKLKVRTEHEKLKRTEFSDLLPVEMKVLYQAIENANVGIDPNAQALQHDVIDDKVASGIETQPEGQDQANE